MISTGRPAPATGRPLTLTVAVSNGGLTGLELELARAGNVQLSILDVTGRLVHRLWNAPLGAGRHTLTWDGRDGDGRLLTGIYFARATANGHAASARVIRVR